MSKPKYRAYIEFSDKSQIYGKAYVHRANASKQMTELRERFPECVYWWVQPEENDNEK